MLLLKDKHHVLQWTHFESSGWDDPLWNKAGYQRLKDKNDSGMESWWLWAIVHSLQVKSCVKLLLEAYLDQAGLST